MKKSFQDYKLDPNIIEILESKNFINPTEVQQKSLEQFPFNKDLIFCAETGSGKTGAYGIPLLQGIIEDPEAKALVLAPTRELVQQIAEFLRSITEPFNDIRVTALVGGADMRKQLKSLKRLPKIIVATPGRLTDHLRRRSLKLDTMKWLVIDEGDRMLDMGFAPQLDEILKFLPEERRTLLFTATLDKKVQKLTSSYLDQPQRIDVGRVSLPVKAIKQSLLQVSFKEKEEKVLDEVNKREGAIIVFARTQKRTYQLAKFLKDFGLDVDLIHGGRSQGQRNKAIQSFRKGKSRILCATDIAARGIDVPQVAHIINFDLPSEDEDYVHRIGRTARNGADGEALSFVTPEEISKWNGLVRKFQIPGLTINYAAGQKPKSKNKSGRSRFKSKSRLPKKKSTKQASEDSGSPFKKKKKGQKKSNARRSQGRPGAPKRKSSRRRSAKS